MIFGKNLINKMVKILLTALFPLFLLFFIQPVFALNNGLQKVLLPFNTISHIKFSYTEIRKSVFFKKEQYSNGIITYKKPDIIIKEVLKPQNKTYKIVNNVLTVSALDRKSKKLKTNKININNFPQLYQFVNLVKSILSGDIKFIQSHYTFKLDEKELMWTLTLFPIKNFDAENIEQELLKKIKITANHEQLLTIKMLGFGGESSEIIINKILERS